ncbi:MAG: hypothetical protein NTX65_12710 [Ignavibacteriales bacterium]|nr:hypothetical protein [Ignavibacteriales bacterium]
MRYTKEILRLQNDPDYPVATEILQSILLQQIPDREILAKLYGGHKAQVISDDLKLFYELNPYLKKVLRKHISSSSTEISRMREVIETNEYLLSIQSMILFNKLPDVSLLAKIYGQYSDIIQKVFKLYLELGIKRKCGITSACHLNRVGAVVFALKLDESNYRNYVTIAAMHDVIEDLFFLARDKNDDLFSLERYDEFVELFIPLELTESIKLLTNHFDLIIYHVVGQLQKQDKSIIKENLLIELEKLSNIKCSEINKCSSQIYHLLKAEELCKDIIETAKWLCYKNLYIVEMARLSHEKNNYRPFEIKAVDLSDNGHGRDALPMYSRIKNLIKQSIWAREGFALKSTWLPLNNRVMEIQEDALVHAEHMIIRDLLEPQSAQDFLVSSLLKIKELQTIFYLS